VLAASDHRRSSSDRVFKLIALVASLGLAGFIVFVVVRGPSPSGHVPGTAALAVAPPAVLKAGTPAPAFSLPRLGGGAPVTLAGFRGQPVVLNFFASWCPDCRAELAAMGTVARQESGRVAVVGVDSNDTSAAAAARVLATAHATYPVGVDAHATVAGHYLLTALPVTYFLNARGRVVGAAFGAQTVASLDHWVARLGASPS
jgi:peroxiredoxin